MCAPQICIEIYISVQHQSVLLLAAETTLSRIKFWTVPLTDLLFSVLVSAAALRHG